MVSGSGCRFRGTRVIKGASGGVCTYIHVYICIYIYPLGNLNIGTIVYWGRSSGPTGFCKLQSEGTVDGQNPG